MAELDYISAYPQDDHHPLSNSAKNPRTSRNGFVEHMEAADEVVHGFRKMPEPTARKVHHRTSNEERISHFLNSPDSEYDTNRGVWETIPVDPEDEAQLQRPFVHLVNAIAEHFSGSPPPGWGSLYQARDLCQGHAGPSFEAPEGTEGLDGIGYTNVAAVVDVRTDKRRRKRKSYCTRLAVFNRQIFIQHLVRSLLVTEKSFCLVHHDHSGVYLTPLFNVHDDAPLLVQFIVGLTSLNEEDLGLDTSVQWSVDPVSGRKTSGTITLDEYDEEPGSTTTRSFDLDMSEPPFLRPGILGRGTVVWYATDPTSGEPVVIKDCWYRNSQRLEYEDLLAARGIEGVVQMLAYQDRCAETADFVPADMDKSEIACRFKVRMVLKRYGPSIWFFWSRLQLLQALLDAIIGHHELCTRGILHRDISVFNILMGNAGAPEGSRGVLIDLGLAAPACGGVSLLPPDPNKGTLIFQPIIALRHSLLRSAPLQDYMDELESLLYVLSFFLYAFEKPGVVKKRWPRFLELWGGDNVSLASDLKLLFTLGPTDASEVSRAFWGPACLRLMKDFHGVVRDARTDQEAIYGNRELDMQGKIDAHAALSETYDTRFAAVRTAFDKAIAVLEEEGLNDEERESYPEDFTAPELSSSTW